MLDQIHERTILEARNQPTPTTHYASPRNHKPFASRRMTSVLHVSQAVEYGVGRYLSDLVTDQARRGWRVDVAVPPSERLEALCARQGVAHHRWDARRSPGPSVVGEMRRLTAILHRVEPDVVHLHSSKAGLVGRLVVRRRRPTIFSPHGWSFLHEGRMMQRASLVWERAGARWADLIVCGSEAERRRGEQAGIRAELPRRAELGRPVAVFAGPTR